MPQQDKNQFSDIARQIKESLRLSEYIGRFIKLKRAGSNFVGLCPFHDEKTPSFMINDKKGFFYCFGCKATGDIIDFESMYNGRDKHDALLTLADLAGVDVSEFEKTTFESVKKAKNLKNVFKIAQKVFSSEIPVKYLEKRGITAETAKEWGLGFGGRETGKLENVFEEHGEDIVTSAIEAGILSKNGNNLFRNRLILPLYTAQNEIIGFTGRALSESNINHRRGPKYLHTKSSIRFDKKKFLYGLNMSFPTIRETKEVIVVEGNFDVLSLWQVGIRNVVGVQGSALSVFLLQKLRKLADRVFIMLDGDKPGQRAMLRIAEQVLGLGLDGFRLVRLPELMDPDDLVRQQNQTGNTLFSERLFLETALTPVDYFLWYQGIDSANIKSINKIKNLARKLKDKYSRDFLFSEVAKKLGIAKSIFYVRGPIKKSNKNTYSTMIYNEQSCSFLGLIMSHPALIDEIIERGLETLFDGDYQDTFEYIKRIWEQGLRANEKFDIELIQKLFDGRDFDIVINQYLEFIDRTEQEMSVEGEFLLIRLQLIKAQKDLSQAIQNHDNSAWKIREKIIEFQKNLIDLQKISLNKKGVGGDN